MNALRTMRALPLVPMYRRTPMSKYIRTLAAPLTLALVFAACASKDDTLAQDSALNRDLAMAGRDSTVQPQLQDNPATTPTPAPAAKTPARKTTTSTGSTSNTKTPAATKTASGNTAV